MYELLVIGDDPAGLATASRAARQGLSVGLACPSVDGLQSGPFLSDALRGLIPELAVDALRGGAHHRACSSGLFTSADLRRLVIGRVEAAATDRLNELRGVGVNVHVGQPRFLDEHTVEVAGTDTAEILRADCIAVATGAAFANDLRTERLQGHVVNADQILQAATVPGRLVVIGADPRGIEFAGLFAASGSKVLVVDGKMRLDPGNDADMDMLIDVSMALGVGFRLGADVVGLDLTDEGPREYVNVHLDSGNRLVAERILVAGRRIGRTRTLDLPAAGLVTDDCYRLWCDHQHRTWLPHIYGVGEVVGFAPRDLDIAAQAKTVVDAIVHTSKVPAPLGLRRNRSRAQLRVL